MLESSNINKSMNIDTSFNEQIINKENEINQENEYKNPYLKNDDVPKIEIKNKNEMIYDEHEYKIDEYLKEVNKVNNDFLDASIYNYCKKCRKNVNKYFCKNCNKNLCEKCYKELNCYDNSPSLDLDYLKNSYIENIKEIKNILNNNIIHIKEEDEIIKKINDYINNYIINNDKYIDYNDNLINNDLSLNKNIENVDILLINQIISEEYINYFHYKNIENILNYLRDNYYIKDNNKYNGYGKIIYENGEYYIGVFKNGLRNGKGILYYNNEKLTYAFWRFCW